MALRGNEVEEVRTRALSQWTSRERQLEEAREKQQKANVPKPKRHYWRHKDKVVSAVKGVGAWVYLRSREQEYRRTGTRSSDVFELIVNIFLLDSPITAQTLIRNAKTSAYARHHEFCWK